MPMRNFLILLFLFMLFGAPAAWADEWLSADASPLDQLPSYRYDPSYNPEAYRGLTPPSAQIPAQVPAYQLGPPAPQPPYMGLETRSGIDLGAQASYYQYREPNQGNPPSVTLSGAVFAFNPTATLTFGPGFFATGDFRYGFGPVDYRGSGSISNRWDELWELRGLIGKDLLFQNFALAPYLGFGYRDLYNDNRGITSTGAAGYRRENQLFYLPFGIKPRFHLDSVSRITSTLEYDAVLSGQQKSWLSDVGNGDPDITNQQHSGYGLRGDIMYETQRWAVGPFFNYWNIDQSSPTIFASPSSSCGGPLCVGTEPFNHTYEAGVQFIYHLGF